MSRIMIAGDIHGDSPQVKYLINHANMHGADKILQVGDFGYWPHMYPEFLSNTQRRLEKANKHLYWIDGNHENFDALLPNPQLDQEGFHQTPFTEPLDNIHYIPRGHTWNWDGVRFMGFGGAPSIDKMYRTEGQSWWPQEIPSRADEDKVFSGPENSADVLALHDSPRFPSGLQTGYKDDAISQYNRKLMAAIADHVKPKIMFHGHYHHNWRGAYHGMPIIGLNMHGTHENSYHILDTDNYL